MCATPISSLHHVGLQCAHTVMIHEAKGRSKREKTFRLASLFRFAVESNSLVDADDGRSLRRQLRMNFLDAFFPHSAENRNQISRAGVASIRDTPRRRSFAKSHA